MKDPLLRTLVRTSTFAYMKYKMVQMLCTDSNVDLIQWQQFAVPSDTGSLLIVATVQLLNFTLS